jgi:hypothetical protein
MLSMSARPAEPRTWDMRRSRVQNPPRALLRRNDERSEESAV